MQGTQREHLGGHRRRHSPAPPPAPARGYNDRGSATHEARGTDNTKLQTRERGARESQNKDCPDHARGTEPPKALPIHEPGTNQLVSTPTITKSTVRVVVQEEAREEGRGGGKKTAPLHSVRPQSGQQTWGADRAALCQLATLTRLGSMGSPTHKGMRAQGGRGPRKEGTVPTLPRSPGWGHKTTTRPPATSTAITKRPVRHTKRGRGKHPKEPRAVRKARE